MMPWLHQKIAEMTELHECAGMDTCPVIITRKELIDWTECALVNILVEREYLDKLRSIKSGYVGQIMGADVYVFDKDDK